MRRIIFGTLAFLGLVLALASIAVYYQRYREDQNLRESTEELRRADDHLQKNMDEIKSTMHHY